MDDGIKERSFTFAAAILRYVETLPRGNTQYVVGNQLLRSGTSIGANVEEALGARSRKEFINSMNIAKREARETRYWLRLLQEAGAGAGPARTQLLCEVETIVRILTAIVKTSQRNTPVLRSRIPAASRPTHNP